METEYKLSYTASEIDEKLGKIDNLVSTVNGIAPDAKGNVNISTDLSEYAKTTTVASMINTAINSAIGGSY